jgi:hypothetical protein
MLSIIRRLPFVILPSIAILLAAAGCVPIYGPALPEPGRAVGCEEGCADSVGVTFLGVGGFLVRHRGQAVLMAPHFSKPGGHRVALNLRALPDTAKVNREMERLLPDSLRRQVRAILVGHSHYDHLMDVPHIAKTFFRADSPRVRIYGNDAMIATLWYDTWLRGRMMGMEGRMGTHLRPGLWTAPEGSRIRFMALRSEHAPHLFGKSFIPRRATPPRTTPPERPWEWQEGQTLAFLVDFLDDDGRVLFRLHYQDSASNPPLGFIPPLPESERAPLDVALLTGASFHQVSAYPDSLLSAARPRQVVLGHTDDFVFSRLSAVPGTPLRTLNGKLDWLLGPGRRWNPRIGETRWYRVWAPGEAPPPSAGRARR